jgi:hypothetical protein
LADQVFDTWCIFFMESISQFSLVTFRVLSSDTWVGVTVVDSTEVDRGTRL